MMDGGIDTEKNEVGTNSFTISSKEMKYFFKLKGTGET